MLSKTWARFVLCALTILTVPFQGHAGTACENLFDRWGGRQMERKHTLYFSLKKSPNEFIEAMLYETPKPTDDTLLLFFPGEENTRKVGISKIKIDSIMVFDTTAELVKYRVSQLKPGQKLKFESYQSEQEMKIEHAIKRVIHGDQYIGDSVRLPRSLRPRARLLPRAGVFVKEDFQYPYNGFVMNVVVGENRSMDLFIPYDLVRSETLALMP